MARIRTIKPEFWTSEQIAECSPNARLLFIGMWNFCDDSGVHPANIRRLQMQIFPCGTFNKSQVQSMVSELLSAELIEGYEVGGAEYWLVTGFTRHQKIDQPTFKHPLPDGKVPNNPRRRRSESTDVRRTNGECSPNSNRTDGERSDSVRPRKGREGKGKEEETSKDKRTRAKAALDFAAWPQMPSDQVMTDWKKLRASKKAPISQTVINQAGKELQILSASGIGVDQALAICCERGWQGLKAEWIFNHLSTQGVSYGQGGQNNRSLSAVERVRVANGMDPETGDFLDGDWLGSAPRFKDVN